MICVCRERARRRNCELDRGELSVVRLSPVKCRPRAVSLVRSPRPPPTLELDTVLEERSDPEQTTLSQVLYNLNHVHLSNFKHIICLSCQHTFHLFLSLLIKHETII